MLSLVIGGIIIILLGGLVLYVLKLVRDNQRVLSKLERVEYEIKQYKKILNNIAVTIPDAHKLWEKLRKRYKSRTDNTFKRRRR